MGITDRDSRRNQERNRCNNISTGTEVTKKLLIDYIYNTIDVSKFDYKLIREEANLIMLQKKGLTVSHNFSGFNCYLVFKKIKDKYYSFIIDKKALQSNRNQVRLSDVVITPISVRLDLKIYDGTIIDGTLLHSSNRDDKKVFIISDLYYFRGEDEIEKKLNDKMINIETYLDIHYNHDDDLSNVILEQNIVHPLQDTAKLVKIDAKKHKYAKHIRGLTFYQEKSGTKLLYIPQENKEKIERPLAAKNLIVAFEMRKTDTVDVYKLYLLKKSSGKSESDKKIIKSKKFALAHIPTMACSELCKKLFEGRIESGSNSSNQNKGKVKGILVDCKYITEKGKWEPIRLSKANKAEIYETVEEKISGK